MTTKHCDCGYERNCDMTTKPELICCPFCHEMDFDLEGLKNHLVYDCSSYRYLPTGMRKFTEVK